MDRDVIHTRVTRWSRGLVITGIVIAVINMALAWFMLFVNQPSRVAPASWPVAQQQPGTSEPAGLAEQPTANGLPDASMQPEAEASTQWLHALQKTMLVESEMQTRQPSLLLAFCFALVAIGFSLFVMGIEGALAFHGDAREFGSVAIKVSSPGVFCIFLAALLIALNFGRPWSESAAPIPESQVDVIRAEADAQEQVIRAETEAKEQMLRAETEARERRMEIERSAADEGG